MCFSREGESALATGQERTARSITARASGVVCIGTVIRKLNPWIPFASSRTLASTEMPSVLMPCLVATNASILSMQQESEAARSDAGGGYSPRPPMACGTSVMKLVVLPVKIVCVRMLPVNMVVEVMVDWDILGNVGCCVGIIARVQPVLNLII